MRVTFPTFVLSAAMIAGLSSGTMLAQDQNQPGTASSQASSPGEGHHHAANPQRQAKRMAKKLNLTQDQQSKIEPILSNRDQQIQSARADTSMSPQDRHTKMRSIHQDSNREIEAVLNDQQKQQYEQMKANHHARKQGADATS